MNIEKVKLDDEVGQILKKELLNKWCPNYVLVGEDRTTLSEQCIPFLDSIKNFEICDSDVWVPSFPKAGSTWSLEMVWMIINNLDFKGGEVSIAQRFPFLEACATVQVSKFKEVMKLERMDALENSINQAADQKKPRMIKTHLPFSLLPDQIKNGTRSPKIIYVMRNPKDVCVSYYHHGTLLESWETNVENFAKVFLSGKVLYGPYWKHVLGYWEKRNSPNLLMITYEDMKSNLKAVIQKVAMFLEKQLTNEQIEILCQHLSFESMKKNKSLNREYYATLLKKNQMTHRDDGHFMRSGVVGKYKEELSSETVKNFNDWIVENIGDSGFEKEYTFIS